MKITYHIAETKVDEGIEVKGKVEVQVLDVQRIGEELHWRYVEIRTQ